MMPAPKTSLVYFGTPEFAVAPLVALLEQSYEIKAVVTQPDRRSGRGKKMRAPEVKTCALEAGLEVWQPEKINQTWKDRLQALQADVFVVCAYGKILSQSVIDMPKHIINIHASLLPKYRGAAPIHAAIKAGETETGVSVMQIVKDLDAGDVMLTRSTPIEIADNVASVTKRLSDLGAEAICEALIEIERDRAKWHAQDQQQITYAHKILPEDAKISWDLPALQVHNFVRSYAPSPGAFTFLAEEKIKILQTRITDEPAHEQPGCLRAEKKALFIACQDQWLEVQSVQPPGKKAMQIVDFLNGYRRELPKCV